MTTTTSYSSSSRSNTTRIATRLLIQLQQLLII